MFNMANKAENHPWKNPATQAKKKFCAVKNIYELKIKK